MSEEKIEPKEFWVVEGCGGIIFACKDLVDAVITQAAGAVWTGVENEITHVREVIEPDEKDEVIRKLRRALHDGYDALQMGIANQKSLYSECMYHRHDRGLGYADALRTVDVETAKQFILEQQGVISELRTTLEETR